VSLNSAAAAAACSATFGVLLVLLLPLSTVKSQKSPNMVDLQIPMRSQASRVAWVENEREIKKK
jgi:hypothetical protein